RTDRRQDRNAALAGIRLAGIDELNRMRLARTLVDELDARVHRYHVDRNGAAVDRLGALDFLEQQAGGEHGLALRLRSEVEQRVGFGIDKDDRGPHGARYLGGHDWCS